MKRTVAALAVLLLLSELASAQFTRYVVRFRNKGGTPYTLSAPLTYLSQRAVDRRTRYSIPVDSTDLPVTPSYVSQLRAIPNVTVLNVSKWMNAVSIQTSDAAAITAINALPFVQTVAGIAARPGESGRGRVDKFEEPQPLQTSPPGLTERGSGDVLNYGTTSYNEIHLHNGEFLHNIGLQGQGMVVTLLDAGFFNYTTLRSFDSVNQNGQIKSTWDFVSRHASVTEDHPHGMQCLSTIAANIPGQFVGKAPKANFHLFRTEDAATEYPIEEFNWICGAERADSLGSDIISSSLGYYDFDNAIFNYTYSQMNGNTTMSANGADLAAKKGLLIFNALGNEGGNSWRYLITPSDADSVVGVGAVSAAGVVGSFSSYGPSSDGQIKPDVASVGVSALVQTTNNTIAGGNGTSFACPNMAGLGTCLWQGFPEFNNMRVIQALRQAGHKFSNPDDRVGYGIPDMKKAFSNLLTSYATSSATASGCRITVSWNSKDVQSMKYEIERKAPGETGYTKIGEQVPAAGTTLANRSYQFINNLTGGSSGNYSFRIRQIIDTAAAGFSAAYIDTANITLSAPCIVTGTTDPLTNSRAVSVLPNPVSGDRITIVVETAGALASMPIAIYDERGSLVQRIRQTKGAGRKILEVSVSGWAKGIYYIRVFDGNKPVGTATFSRL